MTEIAPGPRAAGPPLTGASTDRLARATEENLFDLFRAMVAHLGGEIDERHGVARHHAFPTNPMFKGVWATRLDEPQVDAAIDETIEWFRSRGAPFFFWWTGPSTAPADLGVHLEGRGLISMEEQQKELAKGIAQTAAGAPIMVADLDRLNEEALVNRDPSFAIVEVETSERLADFKRVFVESYGIPEWAGQAWVDATTYIGIGRTPWRMFVGYLDGAPVATNMLFCGGGVASVYAVATVPEARGRGIGGRITGVPLQMAKEAGFAHAVLFSTEMGVSAYRRLGFELTPWRMNRYLWRA